MGCLLCSGRVQLPSRNPNVTKEINRWNHTLWRLSSQYYSVVVAHDLMFILEFIVAPKSLHLLDAVNKYVNK